MRTLCGCQWIDSAGNPTPDDHAPVGIALCRTDDALDGVSYGGGFAICAGHAMQARRHVSRIGRDRTIVTEWTIEPFAP